MATRWTVTFQTLNGKTAVVAIGDADYTGTPIALTPADHAFSVSRSQSDAITPIVSETGYLRVIDMYGPDGNQHIQDMHPSGAFDRPVSLTVAGTLMWRGYISPESYSADWQPAPTEVEFPVIGLLDALQSANVEDTGVGLKSIAGFIKECLDATGQSWTGVILPCQILAIDDNENVPEFRLRLSRYNFLQENASDNMDDDSWTPFLGDTYYQILEEICRYFGWTASMHGETLILSTPRLDITAFIRVSYANLAGFDSNPRLVVPVTELTRVEFDSLVADGVNHRMNISNGRKRVTVSTMLNSGSDVVPQIAYNGSELHTYTAEISSGAYPQPESPLNGRMKVLEPTYESIELKAYRMNGSVPQEIEWSAPVVDDIGLPSAYLVKATTWLDSEEIFNYSYRNLIRISANKTASGGHFDYDVPMIILKSRGHGSFYPGCAIAINASVFNSFRAWDGAIEYKDFFGLTQWSSFNNNLRVSLCVGDKYWSGTEWVDEETIFAIPAGIKDENGNWTSLNDRGQGAVINMKTLDMPWDGASGFIIPINEVLMGQMVLTFYPWVKNSPGYVGSTSDFSALFIGDLDVEVYSPSPRRDAEGLRLTAPTGSNYQDELKVQLKLTSLKDDRIGHALLWYGITAADLVPIGQTVPLTYPGGQTLYQPERWLLQTLLALYSGPQQRLELEVEYDATLQMWDLCKVDDVDWIIIGMDIDYADEHMKLTLLRYE